MSKNTQTAIDILNDEVKGNVQSAFDKIAKNYSMTWMYKGKAKNFPSVSNNVKKTIENVYQIKGRSYELKNITEGKDVVMIELIESYPNNKNGKKHQTPLVLVLEFKNGKIKTGRHYCDPALSNLYLTSAQLSKAYSGSKTKAIIK